MKIPCDECLLVPVCMHKNLYDLWNSCSIINKFTSPPGDLTTWDLQKREMVINFFIMQRNL